MKIKIVIDEYYPFHSLRGITDRGRGAVVDIHPARMKRWGLIMESFEKMQKEMAKMIEGK